MTSREELLLAAQTMFLDAEGVLVDARGQVTYYTRVCRRHSWATRAVDCLGDLRSCPGCAADLDIVRDGGKARYDALIMHLAQRVGQAVTG